MEEENAGVLRTLESLDQTRNEILQVRNLSDVFGFKFTIKASDKYLILCGQKRRWGKGYKRYALPASKATLLTDLKTIIARGGKIFEVR